LPDRGAVGRPYRLIPAPRPPARCCRVAQIRSASYGDDKPCSKKRYKAVCNAETGATFQDLIVQSAQKLFQDSPFLYQANCFVPDPLTGTVYRDKYSNKPAGYFHCENIQVFSSVLKSLNSCSVKNKEANFLISPAIFDLDHPSREGNQRRGLNNIQYLRHIWFDFENGELKPEEMAEIFPLYQLIIFNTYNHTADAPRFRVIFLTSQRLTSAAYEAVWDNVAAKLKDAGYWVGNKDQRTSRRFRPSGLDVSKRTPTSLYYAPCQARNPADSFFWTYSEAPRQLLNPMVWIENSVVPFRPPFIPKDRPFNDQREISQQKVDLAAVEEATKQWHQAPPGTGNDSFFNYALSLRSAGMSLDQIEKKLEEEARSGRSPHERKKQIPCIMQSLQQPYKKAG
jgi:hypothetical protein